MAYDTPKLGNSGPVGAGEYIVQQGDCLESIAFAVGLPWRTIWDDPRNASVKHARRSANILLPGDRLYIPQITLKTVNRPTDHNHLFVRKNLMSKLRLCIKRVGEPRRNEAYTLEIDGKLFRGKTDANGCIEVAIPPDAKGGTLTVGERRWHQQVIPIELGGMDPVTEIFGVQKRLRSLGFDCQPTGELDDLTSAAVASFQQAEDLSPTGDLDQQTIEKLKSRYGS